MHQPNTDYNTVLLFVFWYCHKRGREVRLEKERLLTEQEVAQLEAEYESGKAMAGLSTTAPEGAPIDAVEAGVREVQQARENQNQSKGERRIMWPLFPRSPHSRGAQLNGP